MNRKEFIESLRILLSEELPADMVEENVRYYDEYIRASGDEKSQREEIARIGQPNIISQTIIESYRMSDGYKYKQKTEPDYHYQTASDSEDNDEGNIQKRGVFVKMKRIGITVLVIAAVYLLIRFAFLLFIRIGLPLLVIYGVVRLIKGASRN